ncbi:plasmid recombination protein [Leisingera aquaemixtae]|uniref:plasmid recombination protein n=1 Tax=Leisingera aquaemixtae TaxID=1396826 RepID=UPI0039841505
MTVHAKFRQDQSDKLDKAPVVLRFAGLFPHQLWKFRLHDKRAGGDLAHVDQDMSGLNEMLAGETGWKERICTEVAEMREHNFEERLRALRAKSRISQAERETAKGPSDPWKESAKGPLREGIVTVNKAWFGGAGIFEWDPERVAEFREVAMKFLKQHFPDDQLRYASAHVDEEAYHIHFVVAVWCEKSSANSGRQVMLQPSANPLLKNYEYAQDLAGETFAKIGITRGKRRAEARRKARADGVPQPETRHHVPPSKWRAEERRAAQAEKKRILGDARVEAKEVAEGAQDLGKATVRKSRKRAIKEAQARKRRAGQETAAAERSRDAAEAKARQFEEAAAAANSRKEAIEAEVVAMEPMVKGYEERAEAAAEKYREQKAAREAEEARLKKAEEKVRVKVAEAEVISDAIETGLELVADGALAWQEASADQPPRLTWGATAPKTKEAGDEKLKEIRPAMSMVTRIAQLVAQTVKRVLAKERQKLKSDADYVRGLRQKWEPEDDARLKRISLGGIDNGPK